MSLQDLLIVNAATNAEMLITLYLLGDLAFTIMFIPKIIRTVTLTKNMSS